MYVCMHSLYVHTHVYTCTHLHMHVHIHARVVYIYHRHIHLHLHRRTHTRQTCLSTSIGIGLDMDVATDIHRDTHAQIDILRNTQLCICKCICICNYVYLDICIIRERKSNNLITNLLLSILSQFRRFALAICAASRFKAVMLASLRSLVPKEPLARLEYVKPGDHGFYGSRCVRRRRGLFLVARRSQRQNSCQEGIYLSSLVLNADGLAHLCHLSCY